MDSKLFNFSKLLTENTFNLVKKVEEKNYYLSEAVSILTETNRNTLKITDSLYSSLLEAESTKEENRCFGEFYTNYKAELLKYKNKMNELVSQFCINVETFVDANIDCFDKCCCCGTGTTFSGVQFNHLLDDDVPNIKPYKAFKKEWILLGKLFQDLDPSTSDEEKTKIAATVYNSLSKEINEGWLDKCIEKITDCEDCNKENFAKVMYDKFVSGGEVEITVDVPTIEQAKLSLKNYTNYISCISGSAEDFCCGVDKIADEIGSMMFRNMDKKFVVKTDEEGVADGTYRLSDYSMNQINLFLTTKLSQIKELLNLYTVALSIKMDCIYKYMQQCVALINVSCDPCQAEAPIENTGEHDNRVDYVECEEEPEEVEDDSDEETEEDDDSEYDLPTDKTSNGEDASDNEDEPTEDNNEDEPTVDSEVDGIENSTPVSGEKETGDNNKVPVSDDNLEDTPDEEEEQPQEESYISDLERDIYLFEAELLFAENFFSARNLNRKYIREADEENQNNNQQQQNQDPQQQSTSNEVTDEAAAKRSLLQRAKDLVQRIKDSYDHTYSSQIKYISDNKDNIMSVQIPSNWTIQKYDVNLLSTLKLAPFNIKEKDLYADINRYLDAKYSKFVGPTPKKSAGNIVSVRITAKVFDEREAKYGDAERNEGYAYVVSGYKKLMEQIQDQTRKLGDYYNEEYDKFNEAQLKDKKVNKESTMAMYFEDSMIDEAGEQLGYADKWNAVNDYFMDNLKISTVCMNIYIKNFKKQYAFLNKLSKMKK